MNKEEISKILSEKLRRKVVVKEIIPCGAGYHSDGYKLVTEKGPAYFVKKVKSEDMGFEFPERKIASLLTSHSMARRKNIPPSSICIAVKNKEMETLPEITESIEIYAFQEFGGEGESYLEMLEKKNPKEELSVEDKEEIEKIVDFIVQIHKIKHPSQDTKKLSAVYNDCLRSVIGHPEYLLLLLHNMPEDSILNKKNQGKFMSLMLENMHYFKDKYERLTALHGDFWGANVFFKKDGSIFVIDYSRMPWGDPGFDIGFWMSQYLFQYHLTKSDYFRKLGDYFLREYIGRTGDKEIVRTMVYSLGLVSAMYASSKLLPGIETKVRKSFFNHICKMLEIKKFFW